MNNIPPQPRFSGAETWVKLTPEQQAKIDSPNPNNKFPDVPFFEDLQCGDFIGSVELIGCVTRSSSPWFDAPYGLVLATPQVCLSALFEANSASSIQTRLS